jgi:hypothetical protein
MASPASSASQPSGSGAKKAEAIGDLLQRLGIEEDELDDLVFEEEESAPKQGIKWMALAKVHTTNTFSSATFEQHMLNAWSPAQHVEIHHLEGNLFTVQCFCLGDWLKVKEGGPWLFRQNVVCIEEYDGLMPPESIELNFFDTWVQIHKLPIGYRNETLIKNLTEKKVGKALKVETNVNGMGNFVRVKIRLDVRKCLARFVSISRDGQREFYQLQYEKTPRFCGACGFFGHSHLECGSGEHDEENLKWGDYLKADWGTWHGRSSGISRGGGRGSGRAGRGWDGGNRGRGGDPLGSGRSMIPWRHNAQGVRDTKNPDNDLEDTASSPGKKQDMEIDKRALNNLAAKRSLDMEEEVRDDNEEEKEDISVDGAAAMLTDGKHPAEVVFEENEKDRKKRTKKVGANSTSLGSAESREGSVRSQ